MYELTATILFNNGDAVSFSRQYPTKYQADYYAYKFASSGYLVAIVDLGIKMRAFPTAA